MDFDGPASKRGRFGKIVRVTINVKSSQLYFRLVDY